MNIALFSDSYLPTKSGIVTVVIQLKKILEDLGHNVVIVTVGRDEFDFDENSPDEKNVFRVKSILSPVGDGQYIGIPFKKEVVAFLKKHNIEIIHAHTEFFMGHMAIVAGKELNVPVVASTHTMWEDYYRYYLHLGKMIPRRVIRKAVQLVYRKFYAFINVSKKAHDYFNKPFMLPHIPSAIIPNAIDGAKFARKECSEKEKSDLKLKLGIKENEKVVLYVGRMVEEKRLLELYEIMKKVVSERNDVKIIFVGSGAMEKVLIKKCNTDSLSGKMLFTGFVDWNNLYIYYAISDVFVTASLSEMHSMTVLEALLAGKCVVCRKDSSFDDTVLDGVDGYSCESDEEMKDVLVKLLGNREEISRLSKNALEICKNFTLERHGKRTVAFYKAVLDSFPGKITGEQLQNTVDEAD
ncbi:MAG: glycosyltransferase [Treponema sp.]|nr:glycosyltransferase [Treponema sp.]